jgi:hypothetical protein
MSYNVVALIHQDPAYKKMTSDYVLGRIMNHEMNFQEVNNIKNLYKSISTSKKQYIVLKATNKSKKKKAIIESPSEEEMALFIKKFNKFISKRRTYKRDNEEERR